MNMWERPCFKPSPSHHNFYRGVVLPFPVMGGLSNISTISTISNISTVSTISIISTISMISMISIISMISMVMTLYIDIVPIQI